jgi:hypothetical protein
MALTLQQRARYALLELDVAHVDRLLEQATNHVRLFDVELPDAAANQLWSYAFDLARDADPRSRLAEWLSRIVRQLDDTAVVQLAAFTAWLAVHHADGFPTGRLRRAILCLGVEDVAALLQEIREDEAAEDVEPVSETIDRLTWRVSRAFHGSTVPGDSSRAGAAQLLADALAADGEKVLEQIEGLVVEQQALRRRLRDGAIGLDHPAAAGSSREAALELPQLPAGLLPWFTRELIQVSSRPCRAQVARRRGSRGLASPHGRSQSRRSRRAALAARSQRA